jgi:two-component sensor histidine kinase
VPLQINNRVIGLMNVWSEFEQPFQDDQVQLCKTLANQIALAIENAYLVGNAAIVKEMNHRVKNNLQNVVMLLQLQLADDKSQLSARDVLHESINRIMSIAAVHDALAQEGFRLVDVADLVRRVTQLVHANMARPDQHLEIEVNGDSLKLPARAATAIALVVNELVQNAMEHAFVGRSEGKISVRLRDEHGNFVIEVRDDGRGSAALRNGERPQSLGLNIVDTLVKDDLRGTFELNHDAQGSVATVTAPISFS